MSFDLRRCSKEDLDRLNAEGRAWRERANKPAQEPLPKPIRTESPPTQLDLFYESDPPRH
jgi:hypothetical protein